MGAPATLAAHDAAGGRLSDAAAGAAGATPTELRGRQGRSGTTVHGWPAVLFGVPFALAGTVVILVARGMVGAATRGRQVPPGVVLAVGASFAVAGLALVAHGAAGVARRRRTERFRHKFLDTPWAWDHPWRVEGSGDGAGRELATALGFAAWMTLFLVPFNWIGFLAPHRFLPFAFGAGLFDLLVVALLWKAARVVVRRARYGPRVLRFARFPFHAGGAVELSLERRGALAAIPALTATLRCVQERYETRGSGKNRSETVVCYELWSASLTADAGGGRPSFDFTFPLPPDAPATRLSERPARYWELDVTSGNVPGPDFAATYLVPVYEQQRR